MSAGRPASAGGVLASRRWAQVLFVLAICLCMVAALRPMSGAPATLAHADKLVHAAAFAGLSLLAWRTGWFSPWKIVLLMAVYGAGMEWAQGQTRFRQADALDWVADMAGTGLMLWALLSRGRTG